MPDQTRPSEDTEAEEAREAEKGHDAGRPPTAEEEAAAERDATVDPKTRKAYEEMTERGAHQQGEGKPGV